MQPPPRGCVLKLDYQRMIHRVKSAAASARLCVETTPTTRLEKIRMGSRLRAAVC